MPEAGGPRTAGGTRWTPDAGIPAARAALDAYLRVELPGRQQWSDNRAMLVEAVLAVVGSDERIVTVAPCTFTGRQAAGVAVVTDRYLHVIDQGAPGRPRQNLRLRLADLDRVSLHLGGTWSPLPGSEVTISSPGQQLKLTRMLRKQAQQISDDLQAAIDWRYKIHTNTSSSEELTGGHAFISYARHDIAQADWLQRRLEAAGIPVWRDTSHLRPGQDWRATIRQAITDNALVFIACFSRASTGAAKSYQNEELAQAIEQLRLRPPTASWLIPARFDDCDIPDIALGAKTLASIQRVDLFGSRAEDNINQLILAIKRILNHDE